jgi:hypothetical protein
MAESLQKSGRFIPSMFTNGGGRCLQYVVQAFMILLQGKGDIGGHHYPPLSWRSPVVGGEKPIRLILVHGKGEFPWKCNSWCPNGVPLVPRPERSGKRHRAECPWICRSWT